MLIKTEPNCGSLSLLGFKQYISHVVREATKQEGLFLLEAFKQLVKEIIASQVAQW